MPPLKLRDHIAIYLSIITLLLSLTFIYLSTTRFTRQTISGLEEYGESIALDSAIMTSHFFLTEDYPAMQQLVMEFVNRPKIQMVSICDNKGKIVVSSDLSLIGTYVANSKTPGSHPGGAMEATHALEIEKDRLTAIAPIIRDNVPLGFSRVSISMAETNQAIGFGKRQGLIVGLSAWILAVLLGTYAASLLSKPMQLLAAQTKRIQDGDFSNTETTGEQVQEIGEFSHALNVMADAIGKREASLQTMVTHLDNLPSPVFSVDPQFQVTYINPIAAKMAGLSVEQCIGQKCAKLFNTAVCNTEQCPMRAAMEQDQIIHGKTTILHSDDLIHIKYTSVAFRSPDGAVTGGLESFTDISELQQALAKSEKRNRMRTAQVAINDQLRGEANEKTLCESLLSQLAQHISFQIGAIYLTREGEILHLTASYAGSNAVSPAVSFRFGEGLTGQAAIEKQALMITDVPENYFPVSSASGKGMPGFILARPILFNDQVLGVIELGSFNQFDDFSLELLDRVLENAAIAINMAQSRQRVDILLEQTKQQTEELQSQREELQVTNEELAQRTHNLERQKKKIEKKNEILALRRNQLLEKTEQLETSSKYKSEFLANMSHELRTPLNSILILSQLFATNKEKNLNKKQVEFAETINKSGTELLNLINEVLDLAKIEAGRVQLDISPLNLQNFIRDMEHIFTPIAHNQNIGFTTSIEDNVPDTITTDAQKLLHIVKNLLSNGIKFTEAGEVQLNITRPPADMDCSPLAPEQCLCITVTDTGIGIVADKLDSIFEAFQQVDGSISRKYGGTGLGLSIAKEYAGLLGGEIYPSSVSGEGSQFTLLLPEKLGVKEQPSAPTALPPKETLVSEPVPELQIMEKVEEQTDFVPDDRKSISAADKVLLIIEDDPAFARILSDLAHERGFKCILADDGESGLYYADFYQPGAIILDIGLPGMDGWQVLDKLKKNGKTSHIPVHFMSAVDRPGKARQKGAIGYLTKPVSVEKVQETLELLENSICSTVKKLLIVEDHDAQRMSMEALISDPGIEINGVATGSEAWQQLQQTSFDCMILDLGLQDMEGFKLLEMINGSERLQNLPVIIYTGRKLSQEEEKRLRHYSDSIIIKGVQSPDRLLAETTLFLHQVEEDLSEEKQQVLAAFHNREDIFTNRKILVVDDDMRNVFALSSVLEEKGMEVIAAENGIKALEMIDAHPDVSMILMDIMMPEMDGFEAIAQIRKRDAHQNTPIIALTAKAMQGDRLKCIEAGANDYLAKPVDMERLLSMLRVWMCR